MARLEIIEYPHPTLKKVAVDVKPEEINDEFRQLVKDMIETMHDAAGVGLAAPQVNISKRFMVIDISSEDENAKPFCLINPVIVEKSGTTGIEEGCLSLPDFREYVERAKEVKVEYLNEWGEKQIIEDNDFLAIVVQHELDHLNGIVAADRISPMKKMIYLKKLKKLAKKDAALAVVN